MVDAPETDPENTILHSFCSCPNAHPTVEGKDVVCSRCKMPYQVVEYEWDKHDRSARITSEYRDAKPSDIGR